MKVEELTHVGTDESGAVLVDHERKSVVRHYRVRRDAESGVTHCEIKVSKVHARGHEVTYWKSVRRGSAPRVVLTQFVGELEA